MMSTFEVREALGVADVLDVRERAGLEVVDADHAVPAREQLVAQVRTQEAGAAGDQAGRHGLQDTRIRRPGARPARRWRPYHRDGTAAAPSDDEHLTVAPIVGPGRPAALHRLGDRDRPSSTPRPTCPRELDLGEPGEFPYTRGVHREMYRKQTWTMRQYAGYASAKESNERYRYLLSKGSTGLSMAFDLPTQLGLDSDNPRCLGEVGRTGVAIDTIDDMRTAFDGIPLDQVSTSMTINAPAACLLLLYELVGEEQGVPSEKLRGTTQNDVLKEYIARGNYIYPPAPTMRLTTDLFQYCHERVPKWNTISISGYHFREKGCSAVQEVAFTLSSGIAYVQAAIEQGPVGRRLRAAPGVLLQRPQQRLPGGRQVPRRAAHVGAHHARALRRHQPEGDDAALPHPDRRRHADRPAAGEQHRARRAAGLRGGVRRHAVAAHQRLRRGARAAHRARGQDRAAHPADPRLRVRRGRHRRPVRRLLLRRVAHRRDRSARERADRQGRRARRLGQRDRVHHRRDRRVGLGLPGALPHRPGHRRRRQPLSRRTTSRCPTCCASTPSPSASRSRA